MCLSEPTEVDCWGPPVSLRRRRRGMDNIRPPSMVWNGTLCVRICWRIWYVVCMCVFLCASCVCMCEVVSLWVCVCIYMYLCAVRLYRYVFVISVMRNLGRWAKYRLDLAGLNGLYCRELRRFGKLHMVKYLVCKVFHHTVRACWTCLWFYCA